TETGLCAEEMKDTPDGRWGSGHIGINKEKNIAVGSLSPEVPCSGGSTLRCRPDHAQAELLGQLGRASARSIHNDDDFIRGGVQSLDALQALPERAPPFVDRDDDGYPQAAAIPALSIARFGDIGVWAGRIRHPNLGR